MSTKPTNRNEAVLRDFALAFPEAHEDFPWGHRALKVKTKTFAWLVADETGLSITAKLPESNGMALHLPFASPTGYGLGQSGWVSAKFGPKESVPLDMMKEWIEESYRAVAPKKLVAILDGGGVAPAPKKPAAKKAAPSPKKKAVARKPATAARKSKASK